MSLAMGPRIHLDRPLAAGATFDLPAAQARHVQVLRLQPGDPLTLFNGEGGEWWARVRLMGRAAVGVEVEAHVGVDRELARPVTLALGMPANERMDALVEKATELGVAAIQPLVCERSVLRLSGERAARRLLHWQGVAVAASEQCGRTRVPEVRAVQALRGWLEGPGAAPAADTRRFMLSLEATLRWNAALAGPEGTALVVLSGPEGGLTAAEEEAARGAGYTAVSLGPRVLRADTAPLAVLVGCGL
jgi:16S rRNA (uracil1498-N3)-methyltransferase